jgi:hypothetical protein
LEGEYVSCPLEPPTMIKWSEEILSVVVAEADEEVAVAVEDADDDIDADEDATVAESVVLPVAAAWNAANLEPGLTAKTIPF